MPQTNRKRRKDAAAPIFRKGIHLLTVRLNPAEAIALDAAARYLRFTKSDLVRKMLENVFLTYDAADPAPALALEQTIRQPPPVPAANALRYDPSEYKRAWARDKARNAADNLVTDPRPHWGMIQSGQAVAMRDTSQIAKTRKLRD